MARPDLIRPQVVLYAAFSEVASGGSPAGVVVDASGLDAETMLQIAAEVGAPATCFVTGFVDGIVDVRFFSTTTEYGMCGHGTVGLVTSLVEEALVVPGADGRVDLVVRSTGGTTEVEVCRRQDGRPEIWMDLTPASFESGGVDSTEVAAQLGVAIDSLDSSLPIERTVSDFTHLIVPLQNLSAMAAVAPDFDGFAGWCRRIGVDTVALIVTDVAEDNHDYRCRDLCPAVGTDEAAATGTTNRALACWLVRQDLLGTGVDGHHMLVAGQGIEVGRPSAVCSEVEVIGGRVDRVRVGGLATRIGL